MNVKSEKACGISLMLVSSLCACAGQLFWKLAVNNELLYLAIGFMLYGAGALAMLKAYRYGEVSVLQPILSLNYVLSLLLGAYILRENVTPENILGCGLIITGVLLIIKSK